MAPRAGGHIEGLPELRAKLDRLERDLEAGADESESIAGGMVAARWRALAPVLTGQLRASISADQGTASATAPHAAFVEYGTKFMPARPGGQEATEAVSEQLETIVRDRVRRRLARLTI